MTLLRQLAASGGPIYQHADFDPPGLAVTAWLHERAGTQPWRMTAADYLARPRETEKPPLDAVPRPRGIRRSAMRWPSEGLLSTRRTSALRFLPTPVDELTSPER